jgi:CRISPR-associated exonuclease Cas4
MLTGKPDYLVKQGDAFLPVEVKSGFGPVEPYGSHVFQLMAYCLLVERSLGVRPPHGILKYRNRTFEIDYTDAQEALVLQILDEMRQDERTGCNDRSHNEPGRCSRCGYRSICDQKL